VPCITRNTQNKSRDAVAPRQSHGQGARARAGHRDRSLGLRHLLRAPPAGRGQGGAWLGGAFVGIFDSERLTWVSDLDGRCGLQTMRNGVIRDIKRDRKKRQEEQEKH
jgi:hypothetical protein